MSGRRRQELYCHGCDGYVQFVVDLNLNGNHVVHCPNCGHEHCRVVQDGVITDIRWDSRNGSTYAVTTTAYSPVIMYGSTTATVSTNYAYSTTGGFTVA